MTTAIFDDRLIRELALELDNAEQTRKRIRPFSARFDDMLIDDAYRINQSWVDLKLARGRSVYGHKIGLTSRAMQQAAGITEPDYGTLLDDMVFEQGSDVPCSRFITPKVEIELAFVLGRRLEGPQVTIFDVLSATEYVIPAIEIIDSRVLCARSRIRSATTQQTPESSLAVCRCAPTGSTCAAPAPRSAATG